MHPDCQINDFQKNYILENLITQKTSEFYSDVFLFSQYFLHGFTLGKLIYKFVQIPYISPKRVIYVFNFDAAYSALY